LPTFSPPTADTVPPFLPTTRGPARRLMRHYKARARGRSVLKTAGVYATVDTPSQTQIDAATEYYAGGHVYTVTQAVADALAAAGYTTGADPAAPPSTLTWGALAGLTWDEFVDQHGEWY
jgi:hypothetical protein